MGTAKRTKKTVGLRYPVEWVARELGVDRKALVRRLETAKIDSSKGVTFAEAFEAWMQKAKRESNRDRRAEAEATTAEVTAAEKLGLLMFRKDAQLLWADLTIETRKVILSKPTWESAKLVAALAKIKLEPAK